jgi:pyrroline-5-carboxylate reductase
MHDATIAMIGCGNMGSSLIGGLLADGYPAEKIWVTCQSQESYQRLTQQFDVNITLDNEEAIQIADVVIFAVKPKNLCAVASSLSKKIRINKPLVMSVAAGVLEKTLQRWLGGDVAMVRAMPNTPCLVRSGATILYANPLTNSDQRNRAESIVRAMGVAVWVENEDLCDAAFALSGCGPAFFFLVIEALQKAGEAMGLGADVARLLSVQTAYGSSRMALESEVDVIELRRRVTSPGGQTEQAIKVLEAGGIVELYTKAWPAAKDRASKLAHQFDEN